MAALSSRARFAPSSNGRRAEIARVDEGGREDGKASGGLQNASWTGAVTTSGSVTAAERASGLSGACRAARRAVASHCTSIDEEGMGRAACCQAPSSSSENISCRMCDCLLDWNPIIRCLQFVENIQPIRTCGVFEHDLG